MSGQLETQQRRSRRGAVAAVLACVVAAAAFVSGCTTDADESGSSGDDGKVVRLVTYDSFALPEDARGDADVVIHASGAPEGLALALRLAAFEATIVEMSWYGDRLVPLALGEGFHSKRLSLRSSQVGHVATVQRPRWDHARRMALALRLLAGDTAPEALLSGEDEFADLPQVMARLAADPGTTLCHRIRY